LAGFQRNFVAERIQSSVQCFKNNVGLDYTNCSCKIEQGYHSIYEVFKNVLGLIYSENLNSGTLKPQFFDFHIKVKLKFSVKLVNLLF